MAELTALTAAAGLVPVTAGELSLTEADLGALTSLSPRRGAGDALAGALQDAHGVDWPAPGRTTAREGCTLIWFGHAHALLAGPKPDPALAAHAALTDQSDAWVALRLEGAGAEDVLARLVPVDLRRGSFGPGDTARTLLGHMTVSVTRQGDAGFLILGYRSMAATLVHELQVAMSSVTARRGA